MKKVIALLLAVMMLMAFAVPAFAEEAPTTGKITIQNATIGQTYKAYLVFPATVYDREASADKFAISYTYSGEKWKDETYFTLDAGGYVRATAAAMDESGHLTAGAIAFLGTLVKDSMLEQTVTAASSKVEFTGLDYGYYYVTSSLGDVNLQNGVEKAVTIDSTTPNATVIDKNQGPSWFDPETEEEHPESGDPGYVKLGKYIVENGKKVTVNSVNYGETVNFETSFGATNYVGEKQVLTYYIHDEIGSGFDGIENLFVKVYKNTKDTSPKTLAVGTDYTVSWENNNHEFSISIPWDDNEGKAKYGANAVIDLTYEAKVNNNAVLAGDGNLNETSFDYRLNTDTPADSTKPDAVPKTPYHESTKKTTTTYVFALGIAKVDGSEKRTLKGAQFSIKQGETVIKAKATGTAGVYEYDPTNGVSTFSTSDGGILIIKGLAGTKDGTTYTVNEVKAPNGYNRVLKDITVTLDLDEVANYTKTAKVYYDKDGKIPALEIMSEKPADGQELDLTYTENVKPLVIANERGVELPVTGGMGTTLFYIVGGALALGAFVLLLAKKRMKSKE